MEDKFSTVSIIGVGLIGGSLSLALKEKNLTDKIIGYGRNAERLKEALRLGIIDEYTLSLKQACEAQLIVLATPLGAFEEIAKEIVNYLVKGSIVIDVGSVKEEVVNRLEKIMPEGVHFIGTHPIAGSDKTGFEHSKKALFEGAKVIITSTENADKSALERVSNMWQRIGAVVEFMNPSQHDRIYALMSHLPHLISFCLVNTVVEIDKNLIEYAGSGFKSSTRIAKSSPTVWADIFMMNSENTLHCLEVFTHKIDEIKKIISQKDLQGLKKFIESAKSLREKINYEQDS